MTLRDHKIMTNIRNWHTYDVDGNNKYYIKWNDHKVEQKVKIDAKTI